MSEITSKSGIRTDNTIEAHNCPIRCTCGYFGANPDDKSWMLCGWFDGSLIVNENLLVVRCQFPSHNC